MSYTVTTRSASRPVRRVVFESRNKVEAIGFALGLSKVPEIFTIIELVSYQDQRQVQTQGITSIKQEARRAGINTLVACDESPSPPG